MTSMGKREIYLWEAKFHGFLSVFWLALFLWSLWGETTGSKPLYIAMLVAEFLAVLVHEYIAISNYVKYIKLGSGDRKNQ